MTTNKVLDQTRLAMLKKCAMIIRGLAMDGVQAANSGHPGLPLGMADAAAVLWLNHLKHAPSSPDWIDRDRFVLSAGHGSMLLYSLLHLTGYDLPLKELKTFRQWNSKTPGHPEHGLTAGVETTTGPLGQGISNAVGMALAERWLAARFNQTENLIDHYTYVIASDGDLMEGISHESCAMAGHLKLGKLIVLYDDNGITIDGETHLAYSDDVDGRFSSYGWHYQLVDGHDMTAVNEAILKAQSEKHRPSIIACKTIIGFGSPNRAGTESVHGSPLGEEELRLTKEALGLPIDKSFYIAEDVAAFMKKPSTNGSEAHAAWNVRFDKFRASHPDAARTLRQMVAGELPSGWTAHLPSFEAGGSMATRKASGAVLNAIASHIPQLLGGSADLTPSNNTLPKGAADVTAEDFSGRYIRYGVREHGMGSVMNGMAVHGGIIPYAGTFLVFSDYMRPAIRLAALMEQRVIYVFTHDSIGLGEDGPTHQPIEHAASLRLIPNLNVIRPGDAPETAYAWQLALENAHGPSALLLTRQSLPVYDRKAKGYGDAKGSLKGGYVFRAQSAPDVVLIGTGSELQLAVAAADLLAADGIKTQVVSMPCADVFDKQSKEYRESVIPSSVAARVAVEAGATGGWHKYVGSKGAIIGLDRFGASAPYEQIYEGLGVTAAAVAAAARKCAGNR